MLRDYSWPGNIRELRNIIERLMVIAPGRKIFDESACQRVLSFIQNEEGQSWSTPAESPAQPIEPLRHYKERMEADYLRKIFTQYEGNVPAMAKALQVHRTGLYRKLHSLGLISSSQRPEQEM